MELERDTLDKLIEYLKEHGYPESSFAIEYKIGKQRIDLAIIDPDTKIPIIVFEVKSRKNRQSIDFGKKQLESYLRSLPDSSVPAYLVFPKEEAPFFEVQRLQFDSETNKIIEESVFDKSELDFNMHKQSRISERIEKNQKDRTSTIDKFKWISWILAVIILAIGILNKLKIFTIDTTDLAILGAGIGLIILPFANKLKFLGMEFERFEMTKKK
jgi:hypothetical protein